MALSDNYDKAIKDFLNEASIEASMPAAPVLSRPAHYSEAKSGDESPPRYSAEHFEVIYCCPNVGTMSTYRSYDDSASRYYGALSKKDVNKYGGTFGPKVPKYGALGSEDYAVKKYGDTFVPKYDARGRKGYAANYRAEAHPFLRWLILYSQKKIVENKSAIYAVDPGAPCKVHLGP
nr:hypothetical protein Iba_chr10eCG6460 [Ipomoea batatas]